MNSAHHMVVLSHSNLPNAVVRTAMLATIFLVLALPTSAAADQIRVLGTQSMTLVWSQVSETFAQQSGHTVVMTPHIAAAAKQMIDAGEPFDVVVLSPAVVDALIREGRVQPGSRVDIMQAPIGVAVRQGAPRPDISTVDVFRQMLLDARSVSYLRTGASGLYLAELMETLGIADALRDKTRRPDEDIVGPMVARGEADLGITAISTLLATPGLDVVGPIPRSLQRPVVFTGAVSSVTRFRRASGQFLAFVTSPAVASAMRAKGLEPIK